MTKLSSGHCKLGRQGLAGSKGQASYSGSLTLNYQQLDSYSGSLLLALASKHPHLHQITTEGSRAL
uniref:Uncharacterized protein n=1 Tax=Oryza brachyantha TaxID=4533 RepID=J3MGW5_ORYBR